MRFRRIPALPALAALALLAAGCGETRTITGNSSPVVTARITLHPAPGASITKADTGATIAVIERRLKDLGIGTYSLAAGDAITIDLTGGADVLRAQLAAQRTGVVLFVPLAADATPPPNGSFPASLGEPLWADDEITSASVGKDASGKPTVEIILDPNATKVFGAWTTNHVGSPLMLLLDGQVVAVPYVRIPIVGGQISIAADTDLPLPIDALAAILDSGPLTPDWRQP